VSETLWQFSRDQNSTKDHMTTGQLVSDRSKKPIFTSVCLKCAVAGMSYCEILEIHGTLNCMTEQVGRGHLIMPFIST